MSALDILAQVLRIAVPYLFAAAGGVLSERAGIIALTLEGYLIAGAFGATVATYYTQSPWVGLGAAGCFSSLVALCPPLALHWFNLMATGQWTAAFEIQLRVNRFYEEGLIPIRRAGYVADKAVFELGRVPGATRRQRPPYPAVPDELFRGLAAAAHRHLPEFTAALEGRGQ